MNASLDMASHREHAPVIDGPLTLTDALCIASQHNIEAWIAAQESKFQQELATQSVFRMLPSLMVGSQYSDRSKHDASASESLTSGKESLELSFSSEKISRTLDVSATWNLLDFGISFLHARQQVNRVFISEQRHRRVKQDIAWQVTRTYWRTLTARESAREAEQISADLTTMLDALRREIEDKAVSNVDGLKRETSLLERQNELRRYRQEYLQSHAELARLLGIPPGTEFELAEIDLDAPVELPEFNAEEMEWYALRHRPELFEKDLEQAISRDEARVAVTQLFPSPAMFLQLNYDSNRYLAFNHWNTAGIRVSWDLLSIPQQLKQCDAIKLQTELIGDRRRALAVAILTQLHLSLIDYADAVEQYRFNKLLYDKYALLLEAIESQAQEGKSHGGEILDHRIERLKKHSRYINARANVTVSLARIVNTVGRDALNGQDNSVAEVTPTR